ncbi:MAG: FHA domain-containing protein [Planctomycetes bacterium]|nr:FHA domain-containing protein [Planctomycetota bacterium]
MVAESGYARGGLVQQTRIMREFFSQRAISSPPAPERSFGVLADALRRPAPPAPTDGSAPNGLGGFLTVGTLPYRPTLWRPIALIHAVDDGREGGELVRVRTERLVIGRSDGGIVIPHDISMSPIHAAIEWQADNGRHLRDLDSATGTFVRATSARLSTGSMVEIGRTRLRFEELGTSDAWLVEEQPGDAGRRHECRAPITTIGRAGSGCQVLLQDPFVNPLHATVRRTPHGWRIANSGWNGLWVRVEAAVIMAAASQFLCGEQRFVFEPLA